MSGDAKKNHLGYIAFGRRDLPTGVTNGLCVSSDLSAIEEWKKEFAEKDSDDDADGLNVIKSKAEELRSESSIKMGDLMPKYVAGITSYRELIGIQDFVRPLLKVSYIDIELKRFAKSHLDEIESSDPFFVYGYNLPHRDGLFRRLDRLEHIRNGLDALPSAILLSIVATFDSYISDTLRLVLSNGSKRVENSERTLSIKDILSMGSFEDVKRKVIDDEIESIMRGSHDDQVKYIEKNFSIEIQKSYDRWGEFIEIFERRNLVAHGNCLVNRIYRSNCEAAGVGVSGLSDGDELIINPKYLRNTTDIILEFGVLLMMMLWKKHLGGKDDEVYAILNDICYTLIRERNYVVSSRLIDFALHRQNAKIEDAMRKMMLVNLANAYKKNGEEERCNDILDKTDWSATADQFKISVASIRGETDKVIGLMPILAQSDAITKEDFRSWPVFDWVRDEVAFRDSFERIYGESIGIASISEETKITAGDESSDGETLH